MPDDPIGTGYEPGTVSGFRRALGAVRRRWRLRRIAEGATIALAATFVAALAGVAAMTHWRFDAGVVADARLAVYAAAGLTLVAFVLARALARRDDARVAAYVEAHAPDLDALVVSAVEVLPVAAGESAGGGSTSPDLARRLVSRATDDLRRRAPGRRAEGVRIRRAGFAAAALVLIAAGLAAFGPVGLRHGLASLFMPAGEAEAGSPYRIDVSPGTVAIALGEDQVVVARPAGFAPADLTLVTRPAAGGEWVRTPMVGGAGGAGDGAFEAFVFNVEAAVEYYVAGGRVESARHRIDVVPAPTVERIDLYYEYPPRTGRPPELVTGGGDIRAVRGTRVEVRVTPSEPLVAGNLRLNGDQSLALRPRDGVLVATLDVERDGHYRIELPVGADRMTPASPEHAVEALPDTMPTVSIVRPGRDVQVTSVEEIELAVSARDDVAVRDLELVLSVNGVPDETIRLAEGAPPGPELDATRVLHLEDRDLAPGDLIAYYFRAKDSAGDPDRETVTDIFFMEVRPFDREYRRARGGGMGGGGGAGGGQGGNAALAAQQRTLVIALFKLNRDRRALAEAVYQERVGAIAAAQTRIRDRVDAIVRRLAARGIEQLAPGFRRMAQALPRASAAMLRVEALLAAEDTGEALPPARKALLHLQRADAAFREVQVAQSNRGGGGGGAAASDLANLFRLEMDRFRTQYEHVQRGRWGERERTDIDEALRRLQELARRQQQELERMHRREALGRGGSESQRALAAEVEEVMRQLERLSRTRPDEEVRASLEAMREAAAVMRRGASAEESRRALDRLREARRLLDRSGASRLARDIEGVRRLAESLAERQARVRRDLDPETVGADPEARRVERAIAEKDRMVGDARRLEARLGRLTEDATSRQPEASRRLRAAASELENEEVAERIARTRQMLVDEAARSEEQETRIARALESARDRIGAAGRALTGGDGNRERTLADLQNVVRGLDNLKRRLEARGDRAGQPGRRAGDGQGAPEGRAGGQAGGPGGPGGGENIGGRGSAFGGGRWGWGVFDADEIANIRRYLEARARELETLRTDLDPSLRHAGDIDAVIEGLVALGEGAVDPTDMAERHGELLALLKSIERAVRDELSGDETPLRAAGRAEPPDRYRALVEDYYRRLSETAVDRYDRSGAQ